MSTHLSVSLSFFLFFSRPVLVFIHLFFISQPLSIPILISLFLPSLLYTHLLFLCSFPLSLYQYLFISFNFPFSPLFSYLSNTSSPHPFITITLFLSYPGLSISILTPASHYPSLRFFPSVLTYLFGHPLCILLSVSLFLSQCFGFNFSLSTHFSLSLERSIHSLATLLNLFISDIY